MVRPTSESCSQVFCIGITATFNPVPAWKGNLCERSLASCLSLFILVPCVALAVYVLLLQTFVLRIEFILAAVLLVFYGLELVLGIVSSLAFSR